MESEHTPPHSEKYNELCVLDLVSEIVLKIIEDLDVFKPQNEEKYENGTVATSKDTENEDLSDERLSPVNKFSQLHKNVNSYISHQSDLVEEDISGEKYETADNTLNDNFIHRKIQDGSYDYGNEDNNRCDKKILLTALHLNQAFQDVSKENDSSNYNLNLAEKKKENVHFNSPVAVVYEFSEKSEVLSDCSTEILSDSDSQDLILSQDENTESSRLELEDGDESFMTTKTSNNIKDVNLTLNVREDRVKNQRDCIMTPGGDCFNVRLCTNFNAVIHPTERVESNDCKQRIPSPQNFNNDVIPNDLELSQNGKVTGVSTVTVSQNLKLKEINFDRQDSSSFESSEKSCSSEKIEPDIYIFNRNENKKDINNQTNCKKESAGLPNNLEHNSIIDNLPTSKSVTKRNAVSEIFTKLSLQKEENEIECSQEKYFYLNHSNATCMNGKNIDTSDITSLQNIDVSDKDIDDSNVNESEQQNLAYQKIHEDFEVGKEKNIDTARECEFEDEKGELSQQLAKTSTTTEDDGLVCSKIENSDMSDSVFNNKREHSSQEMNCSQVSKKSKLETGFNLTCETKKRKLFKVGLDESKNVKLLKLDTNYEESDVIRVPRMLKKLASDVVVGLDENIIFESENKKEEHTNKGNNVFETLDNILVEKCQKNVIVPTADDVTGNSEEEAKTDCLESQQDQCTKDDLCLPELYQEDPITSDLFYSENNKDRKQTDKLNQTVVSEEAVSLELETSEVSCLSEDHFIGIRKLPRSKELISAAEFFSQNSDKNCNVTPCLLEKESDQSVPVIDESDHKNDVEAGTFQLHTTEELRQIEHVYGNENNLLSPKFISATEFLSQNSQESGSTGFTVNSTDALDDNDSQEQDSLEKSELLDFKSNIDFGIDNQLHGINLTMQEQDHILETSINHNPKSVVEITEDGLTEEKMENSVYDKMVSSEMQRNVESSDAMEKKCTTTDQDEQIDADQLDVYIDGMVDQIVPDDKYEGGSIDTGNHTSLINSEDLKAEEHVHDKEDDTACQHHKTQGKMYEKCFTWKYRPSYDADGDMSLPELPDEDQVVTVTPLKTCGKPLRLGLSKRQPVKKSLHQLIRK